MTRFRVLPLLALAAGLLLTAGGTAQPPGAVQPPKVVIGQPGPGGAQGDIPLVPKSAAAFISIRVSDVVDHPDLKPVLEQLNKTPEALAGVTEMVGVLPHEIERVTLFWPAIGSHGPGEPVVVVTTRQPYNEARILKSLKAEPVFDGDFRHRHDPWGPGGAVKKGIKETPATSQPDAVIKQPASNKAGKSDPPATQPPPPSDEDACSATAAAPPGEPLFFVLERGAFRLLFLIDDRTLVFLADDHGDGFIHLALLAQLMQKKATGPLADALAAGGGHTLAAGVYLPPLFREFDRHLPPELAPYAALLAARTGVVTGDLTKTAKLTLKLTFDDAAAARRAGPVLEEGLKTLAGKAAGAAEELKAGRPVDRPLAPLMELAAAGLKKATVMTEGAAVVATTEVDVGPAVARAAADFLQTTAARKKFAERSNNLKQIGLALHNYESTHGKLPNNIYGPKGEMLLSWRVQILPYLEQDALYRQFKLDEPWDSAHNKPLAEQMPKVFEVPGREAPKGKTYFQGFASPDPRKVKGGNPFAGGTWLTDGNPNAISLIRIPDGSSNTIAVAEGRDAVNWTKPEDLPFGEKLPPLGDEKADQLMVLMFDGSVRALSAKIKPEALRALITTSGGEPVDIDDDRPRGPRPGGPGAADKEERLGELLREYRQLEDATAVARRQLDEVRAAAEAQGKETARVAELFKQGAAAKKDYDDAQAKLDELRARVAASEEDLKRHEARLTAAKRELDRAGIAPATANPPPKK